MPCSSRCRVLSATSLAFLAVTTTVASANTIRMHSKGEALPFDHQGMIADALLPMITL